MTIYGIDIASWQAGLDFSRVRAEGFEYVIAKATEGYDYRNPEYRTQRDGSRANGLAFCAYHYVRANGSAKSQVDNFAALEPDTDVPVMLDHELNSGDATVLRAVHDEFVRRGYRVVLIYIPNWYWSGHIGSPDLSGLPPLMSSNYGRERSGFASAMYAAEDLDNSSGWAPYGGNHVAIFQFSQKGRVAGQSLDVNAFKGSRAELDAFFNGTPTDSGDTFVALNDDEQRTIANGAAQLQPFAPAEGRPGLRQAINTQYYNVKDGVKGGWPWLIWADLWNEIVWDGYPNPVDELDGKTGDQVRKGGVVSYVLGIYRDVNLALRSITELRAEVTAMRKVLDTHVEASK